MSSSSFRISLFALPLLASLQGASGCELSAIEARLAAADDHLFWSEFWNETDVQEASAELGYCAFELRQAVRLAQEPECDHNRRAATLGQSAVRRLSAVRLALTRLTSKDVAERR